MKQSLYAAIMAVTCVLSLSAEVDRVPRGTEVTVRTDEPVDARYPSDSRIYRASIDRDVRDRDGNVVIPRGAAAELESVAGAARRDGDLDDARRRVLVDLADAERAVRAREARRGRRR